MVMNQSLLCKTCFLSFSSMKPYQSSSVNNKRPYLPSCDHHCTGETTADRGTYHLHTLWRLIIPASLGFHKHTSHPRSCRPGDLNPLLNHFTLQIHARHIADRKYMNRNWSFPDCESGIIVLTVVTIVIWPTLGAVSVPEITACCDIFMNVQWNNRSPFNSSALPCDLRHLSPLL